MHLMMRDNEILWPGKEAKKPEGIIIPRHLKVLTLEEKPFVYVRQLNADDASSHVSTTCEEDEIPCPLFNATDGSANEYCCRGYCIDLLRALANRINFTYDLALSPDGQFGHYVLKNVTTSKGSSVKKVWTGLIGEVVGERADMIVVKIY